VPTFEGLHAAFGWCSIQARGEVMRGRDRSACFGWKHAQRGGHDVGGGGVGSHHGGLARSHERDAGTGIQDVTGRVPIDHRALGAIATGAHAAVVQQQRVDGLIVELSLDLDAPAIRTRWRRTHGDVAAHIDQGLRTSTLAQRLQRIIGRDALRDGAEVEPNTFSQRRETAARRIPLEASCPGCVARGLQGDRVGGTALASRLSPRARQRSKRWFECTARGFACKDRCVERLRQSSVHGCGIARMPWQAHGIRILVPIAQRLVPCTHTIEGCACRRACRGLVRRVQTHAHFNAHVALGEVEPLAGRHRKRARQQSRADHSL
jgi:hypothetical protein